MTFAGTLTPENIEAVIPQLKAVLVGTQTVLLHADPERAAQLGHKGGPQNRRVYEANEWAGFGAHLFPTNREISYHFLPKHAFFQKNLTVPWPAAGPAVRL
jgi:hypothetical protein